jgi:hypothetical protein
MRDDEEVSPVVDPEPVIPLGPLFHTGPAVQAAGAGPAIDHSAAPAGPCIYTPAESNPSRTSRTRAARLDRGSAIKQLMSRGQVEKGRKDGSDSTVALVVGLLRLSALGIAADSGKEDLWLLEHSSAPQTT